MRTIDSIRRSGVGVAPDATVRNGREADGARPASVRLPSWRTTACWGSSPTVTSCAACSRRAPADARVDGVMSTPVITIDAGVDVQFALQLFRDHAIRRLPVVKDERFVGMLTVDDLFVDLVADLDALTGPVHAEITEAQHDSPVPARP